MHLWLEKELSCSWSFKLAVRVTLGGNGELNREFIPRFVMCWDLSKGYKGIGKAYIQINTLGPGWFDEPLFIWSFLVVCLNKLTTTLLSVLDWYFSQIEGESLSSPNWSCWVYILLLFGLSSIWLTFIYRLEDWCAVWI